MILETNSDELSEVDVAFDQSRSNKSVEPKASIRDLSVWRLINKFATPCCSLSELDHSQSISLLIRPSDMLEYGLVEAVLGSRNN